MSVRLAISEISPNQGLDGFNRRIDHLDNGNGTGGGFPRTGFSTGDDVPSGQNVGEGFFLDGRQLDILHVS
jgi:hypothetical protein